MKRPAEKPPFIGGADDPDLAAHVARLQEKARDDAQAPVAAAVGRFLGTLLGYGLIVVFYALVVLALLFIFAGLYKLAQWVGGSL